ncbi:S1 family peptidase [Pseudobacteriovorax antillogorgiicola]|uniref:Trypsin n=1 Tax=Pseudobacteriovorax antillogorgiicola TaxID=1513793 RepID=A0A1Y6BIU4_9BACT|nr:trypsin-like serine protease [Pseudobacteriovorax antillogorgiicola]TCS57282.1 trypsin [Pseudobacteriovorax antillogorgiicola]SMF03103.1 Trypsin [Pseudobacteriovorax antillogorgiicola]
MRMRLSLLGVCLMGISSCSDQEEMRLDIKGGDPIEDSQFSSVVKVVESGFFNCTGVVVAEKVVLSAAHCFSRICQDESRANGCKDVSEVEIKDRWGATYQVAKIESFPYKYNENYITTQSFDLAVLELENNFLGDITPIAQDLTAAETVLENNRQQFSKPDGDLVSVGFGLTGEGLKNNSDHTKLYFSEVPFRGLYGLNGEEFHIGSNRSHGCKGDSGGPKFARLDGGWQVVGIHSRSATLNNYLACAANDGAIATNLLAPQVFSPIQKAFDRI